MSRVLVFNSVSDSVGQVSALVPRGWQMAGIERTDGGGTTALTLPKSAASKPFLQLGNMVLIEHTTLPAYAGMIDVPWMAKPPAKLTIYNAEYLLTLRYPDTPLSVLTGSVAYIATQILTMANQQEDTFLRPGEMSQANKSLTSYTFDQRNYWDHLNKLCATNGMEIIFRPQRSPLDRKLYVYVDIGTNLGNNTNALLHDGEGGNMIVQSAEISDKIINRVVGTGNQSNAPSRLYTVPMIDDVSRDKYRTRGGVIQFQNVAEQNALDVMTRVYLESVKRPLLKLKILVFDRDNSQTFSQLRLGNSYWVHASKVILPGGVQGWRNIGRTLVMAYNEKDNTVGMTVEGFLG
jgi:hypothetical protein